MPVSTTNTDILTASLGKPVTLAYGRHLVGGNVILKDQTDPNRTILFIALGEGEWDSVEELYLNEKLLTETQDFHFHPGIDGQLSSDGTLHPEGLTGGQKVDSLTPPGVQGLTFSRTAYVALNAPFDVFAPGPEMIVRGIFKTRKVRFFDSNGVRTGYGYSDNPAWQIADLLTAVRGLSDSRLDWASFKAAADYCDALIPINGQQAKRFVSHVAFTEEVVLRPGAGDAAAHLPGASAGHCRNHRVAHRSGPRLHPRLRHGQHHRRLLLGLVEGYPATRQPPGDELSGTWTTTSPSPPSCGTTSRSRPGPVG